MLQILFYVLIVSPDTRTTRSDVRQTPMTSTGLFDSMPSLVGLHEGFMYMFYMFYSLDVLYNGCFIYRMTERGS